MKTKDLKISVVKRLKNSDNCDIEEKNRQYLLNPDAFSMYICVRSYFLLCPVCPLSPSFCVQPSSAAGLRGTALTYTSADSMGDIVPVLEYPQAQVHQSEPLIWCRHYSSQLLNFKDNQLKMSKWNNLNSAGKGGWRITRFFLLEELPVQGFTSWMNKTCVSVCLEKEARVAANRNILKKVLCRGKLYKAKMTHLGKSCLKYFYFTFIL